MRTRRTVGPGVYHDQRGRIAVRYLPVAPLLRRLRPRLHAQVRAGELAELLQHDAVDAACETACLEMGARGVLKCMCRGEWMGPAFRPHP